MNYNLLNGEKMIPSTYHTMIYVKKSSTNDPGYLKFQADISGPVQTIQTMYDINDLDKIYLDYMYPLLSVFGLIMPNKIFVIGLGGGHLPMLARKKFPVCEIKIIELDNAVYVAAKEMGFKLDNKMEIIIGDGIEYCNYAVDSNYDAIFIDLSAENLESFANPAQTFDFGRLKNMLNKGGILAINLLGPADKEILLETLLKYFSCVKIFIVEHSNLANRIYLCVKIDCNRFMIPLAFQMNLRKFRYFKEIFSKLGSMQTFIHHKNH